MFSDFTLQQLDATRHACAVSHFGENLLPATVSAPAVEITYAQQVKVFRSASHTTFGGKNSFFSVFDYTVQGRHVQIQTVS